MSVRSYPLCISDSGFFKELTASCLFSGFANFDSASRGYPVRFCMRIIGIKTYSGIDNLECRILPSGVQEKKYEQHDE